MAAITTGSILLSKAVLKTESVIGTAPSFTSGGRRLMIDPTGYIAPGVTVDDQSDRSVGLLVRGVGSRTTITAKQPTLSMSSPALPLNELPIWTSGISYTAPATIGTAGTAALGIAGTANAWDLQFGTALLSGSISPKTFSIVATGGNANPGTEQYLLNYIMPTKIGLKAESSGLTSASVEAFGQTLAKDTTTLADALPTDVVNMAGRLWKAYYYTTGTAWAADAVTAASTAAISGGSAFSYLVDWSLDITTPNTALTYQAGSVSFTGHSSQATALQGEVSLTMSGSSDAVAQVYDKFQAGTPTYWRLNWTDGSRIVDILASVVFTEVVPLAGDTDGAITMTATGMMVYDATAASAGRIRTISDTLAALP